MKLGWTKRGLSDLTRLHEFLTWADPRVADRTVEALGQAVKRLQQLPRLGTKLDRLAPREVRRLIVGNYELQYELMGETITILRVWHTRERR